MSARIENETELIQTYLAPLAAGYPGALGLKDDAAILTPEAGFEFVVTTDPIIAGVHFFGTDRAGDIAWKALACNISDLAAKGAEPFAYTMALALPEAPEKSWMAAFARGLKDAQTAFGCHLIGGDTDRTPGPLSVSITAFGKVPLGRTVKRGTAKIGDHLFVTGTLGDSALGLDVHRDPKRYAGLLSSDDQAFLVGRYLRPAPRLELIPVLRNFASAALDVSDGLVKDAARIASAAGARAMIEVKRVPLSPPARQLIARDPNRMTSVTAGGDDYEVLFTVPTNRVIGFHEAAQSLPIQISEIGKLEAGQGVAVVDEAGRQLQIGSGGYDHFG